MAKVPAKVRKSGVAAEPALTIGAIASVIVALLAIFHVVIDVNTVSGVLATLGPILSAVLIRAHVTPA